MARRVSDRSRSARARLVVSLALTVTALMFTVVLQLAGTDYTALALTCTGVGIFLSTWFLLDVCISWKDDLDRRRAAARRGPRPPSGPRPPAPRAPGAPRDAGDARYPTGRR